MAGAAAALALFTAVAGGVFYVHNLQHQVDALKVAAVVSKDQAKVTTSQTAAVATGAAIADHRAVQDQLSITVHQDNAHAIEAAPGASALIDPGLNDAGRRGLCRYAAYAGDPGCAGLLQGNTSQLPPTGTANASPIP